MRAIPTKLKREMLESHQYKVCMLRAYPGHICGGRITLEHAIIHAGKQVNERWAIIACCARGQEVDSYQDAHTMDKNLNRWVAYNRAPEERLRELSKAVDLIRERERLNDIYGEYEPYELPANFREEINYPF
jgi:hypothetical protein